MNTSSATVAEVTEISSQSPTSFQDANDAGVAVSAQTLRNVGGVWIKEPTSTPNT